MSIISSIVSQPFKGNPNSMTPQGHIMIGTDLDDQATRIFIRSIADHMNIPNARNSNSVPLLTCSIMLKMFLTGVSMDSIHMTLLRKIAIKQLSMNFVIGQDRNRKPLYDTIGFYENFKSGVLPPLHFSKPDTNHMTLYTDNIVNEFMMESPIWWASMMSMIGLFDNQLPYYEGSLRILNIVEPGVPITSTDFLRFIYDEYSSNVEGKYVLGHVKLTFPKTSVITTEPFPEGVPIFQLNRHNDCSVDQCATMDEIERWFLPRGCPYCRSRLSLSNFTPTVQVNNQSDLQRFYDTPKQMIRVKKQQQQQSVPQAMNVFSSKGIIIMLQGTVGSGKTSSRNELVSQLKEKYPLTYFEVFCPDDISKTGARNGVQVIKTNLFQFVQRPGSNIGIIDTCGESFNEADRNKTCFDVSLANFDVKIFRPNLIDDRDLEGYLAFSLDNVLSRPMHSSSTEFYLNHHGAGVETCVKVHTNKAKTLFKKKHTFNINQKSSLGDILAKIRPEAERYRLSLPSVYTQVQDFIANHIQL
jgi:hypothetical protein